MFALLEGSCINRDEVNQVRLSYWSEGVSWACVSLAASGAPCVPCNFEQPWNTSRLSDDVCAPI